MKKRMKNFLKKHRPTIVWLMVAALFLLESYYTTVDQLEHNIIPESSISASGPASESSAALAEAQNEIPEYNGEPYVIINNNVPFFTEEEITTDVFEEYSPLDNLGRCGTAYANICMNLMPDAKRGDISSVKPSGWKNKPYDFVDGGYLYNRCHLIGHQLAGEDANERNLITGTRYFNVIGMLPFENMVADYIKENPDNHLLYRVTPIYEGDNLVADGVLMEGYSVEDNGADVEFCVFCYNVQPGVVIDYKTGKNWAA